MNRSIALMMTLALWLCPAVFGQDVMRYGVKHLTVLAEDANVPDGATQISELKTGQTLLRPPTTHSDEALDAVETILIEFKNR